MSQMRWRAVGMLQMCPRCAGHCAPRAWSWSQPGCVLGGPLVQTTHCWMLLLLGPYAEGQAGPLVGGQSPLWSCGVSPWAGSGSSSGRTHHAHTWEQPAGRALILVDQEAEEQSLRAWRPCYIPVLRVSYPKGKVLFRWCQHSWVLSWPSGVGRRRKKTLSSVPSKDALESWQQREHSLWGRHQRAGWLF